ncbi:unnamed protein product [Rotaria sp. Silwood1]|nr:unnamed protein product [Rotaria sp. Silwood1]CAF1623764.1 unnamed protein product [Rotaria sp. Silwood1]CAF3705711.1 unnamed protein product [Rotaria sp. Silwood1]CAF3797436.1 unnamed protein product [Rotaria sp. Silwood1]CAF4977003.1 unnamed protein product [Rotaria sp. Silwood1]
MQIHILLCATAILTVTQSTPIVITRNDVKDEGITSQTNVTHVQNRAYFVAVKVPRSKRQWGPGVHPLDVRLNRPIVGPTIPLDERTSIFTGAYVDSQGNIDGGRIGFTRTFEEPFSTVPSVVYGDEQFYGTGMIGWLHQSKNMVRFVGQDLLIGTILSI